MGSYKKVGPEAIGLFQIIYLKVLFMLFAQLIKRIMLKLVILINRIE